MSLIDDLRALVKRQRVYAGMREGGTSQQAELSALRDLCDSMTRGHEVRYANPRCAPRDPPDCLADLLAGGTAAIEVTEFVSADAVRINEQARPAPGERPPISDQVMARWDRGTLLEAVAQRLASKDAKTLHGGPYAEYVVLIYTHEPLLVRSQVTEWLDGHRFGPFRQIARAYFLLDYEPHYGYPYQLLDIGGV